MLANFSAVRLQQQQQQQQMPLALSSAPLMTLAALC
jgi:hypothetical protein